MSGIMRILRARAVGCNAEGELAKSAQRRPLTTRWLVKRLHMGTFCTRTGRDVCK